MFTATLSKELIPVCKKFMHNVRIIFIIIILQPFEIYVDDEKLTLHGLLQHYCELEEKEKNRKLNDLLDALEFNQGLNL